MNIFPFKKQKNPVVGHKQKLFLFFAIILIVVSIFPVMAAQEAKASEVGFHSGTPIFDNDDETNCPINKMNAKGVAQFNKPYILRDSNYLGLNDQLDFYIELEPFTTSTDPVQLSRLAKVKANCERDANEGKIIFYLVVQNVGILDATTTEHFFKYYAKSKGDGKLAVTFPSFKLRDQILEDIHPDFDHTINFRFFITYPGNQWKTLLRDWPVNYKIKAGADTTTPGNDPVLKDAYTSEYTGPADTSETAKLENIGITTTVKDKYRVLLHETDEKFKAMTFGQNGLDPIIINWVNGKGLALDQKFEQAEKDQVTGPDLINPTFKGTRVGIYYASTGSKSFTNCFTNPQTEEGKKYDCNKIIFDGSLGLPAPRSSPGNGVEQGMPFSASPVINETAWQKSEFQTPGAGGKYGSVEFSVLPFIAGPRVDVPILYPSWVYVAFNQPQVKFTVEVYDKQEDIIQACIADGNEESKCTPEFARYGIGKSITTDTATSESSGKTTTQTLYEFIVKIISAVVIFLTSMVYRIFALFVVPVINALLNVKPYQDAFVNIIYAGWLILRNLANIFFIIALLVVGLRILFQQSAAGAARGFIIRLVLMALLVNFSLVIAQGVVGIADTVQSQFLPGNTRVIEALGSKLMVEPIVSFRSAVGGGDENGQIQGDANVGDIAKPIVLLMLAVAAFFSFLAIAAFLAVRLVALMILYMVSPIAYVGYVMDETKSYAQRWWSEFIKYAFLTPILVFFLNIAALVATATASNNGNVIRIDDSLEAGIVAGGLTIVSHFIVLLIIFAGMKYALSSGTIGAKTIVDYAQKGFKNSLTKWPGAVKDLALDQGASGLEKAGYNKAARALTAVGKPLAFGKSMKKAWLDEPKKEREERETKRLDTLAGVKVKGTPLKKYWDGIKEKGLGDEDPASLQDLAVKSAKERNNQKTGEALVQLGKNGNFNEILAAAEQATGKDKDFYNKDAAGLNAAVKDLQKQVGFSDDEATAMMKHFDSQARKDKKNKHYSGNIERGDDGKAKIVELNADNPKGEFKPDYGKKWVDKQVDDRLDLGGISEDLKQTNLDSMVYGKDGDYTMTNTQLELLSRVPLSSLTSKEIDKFKSSAPKKIVPLTQAWNASGRAGLQKRLLDQGAKPEDVAARLQKIDQLFTADDSAKPKKADSDTSNAEEPTRQRSGFANGRPIIVQGGGTINPGAPASFANQAAQMNATQNLNNTVNFSGGSASTTIGDVNAMSSQSNRPPAVGYADSNIEAQQNNKADFVDTKPKQRAGFTAEFPKKRQIGFAPASKNNKTIIPAPDSKSSPTIKPGADNSNQSADSKRPTDSANSEGEKNKDQNS